MTHLDTAIAEAKAQLAAQQAHQHQKDAAQYEADSIRMRGEIADIISPELATALRLRTRPMPDNPRPDTSPICTITIDDEDWTIQTSSIHRTSRCQYPNITTLADCPDPNRCRAAAYFYSKTQFLLAVDDLRSAPQQPPTQPPTPQPLTRTHRLTEALNALANTDGATTDAIATGFLLLADILLNHTIATDLP